MSRADPRRHVDHVLVVVDEFVEPVDQSARLLDRAAVSPRPRDVPLGLIGLGSSCPADRLRVAGGGLDLLSQLPQLARIAARERDLAAPRRTLDLEGQLMPVRATGERAVLDPRADFRRQLVGPADRAHPVGVEDQLVAIGGQRLRRAGRPQLTLRELDRTSVRLLGLPERPLGGSDLVVLLAHQLPQRPSSDFDGITLALRSRHEIHTSPSLGRTRARLPHPPRERNAWVTTAARRWICPADPAADRSASTKHSPPRQREAPRSPAAVAVPPVTAFRRR